MQLDARLAAIAALVPHGTTLADIGADHAYLAATLVLHGHAPRAVVGDLSAGACEAARRTVGAQRLTQQIDVRQGDGLSVLLPGEAESIVIAGMGGALIADILAGAQDILGGVGTLVLQPRCGQCRRSSMRIDEHPKPRRNRGETERFLSLPRRNGGETERSPSLPRRNGGGGPLAVVGAP